MVPEDIYLHRCLSRTICMLGIGICSTHNRQAGATPHWSLNRGFQLLGFSHITSPAITPAEAHTDQTHLRASLPGSLDASIHVAAARLATIRPITKHWPPSDCEIHNQPRLTCMPRCPASQAGC
eukprot:533614-Pelagomonas_calceolata.AAC.1